MVCLRTDLLARTEQRAVVGVGGHRQLALADVDPHDPLLLRRRGVRHVELQTDQQVELLVGSVVPELGGADAGAVLQQRHVARVARVGQHHPPVQRQQAHPLLGLEAEVPPVGGGQRGGAVRRCLVQPLVTLLGRPRGPCCRIGLRRGPQRLVGRPDLARHIAGELCGQAVTRPELAVGGRL
jgi:hypothetical protein